jgi:N-acetylmuramoyl-L-alanine amidase
VRSHWLLLGACSALLFASPIHAAPVSPSTPSVRLIAAETTRPTQLEEIRVTRDGFFIRTQGEEVDVDQDLSRDRRQLTLKLKDTTISADITAREFTVNRYGVNRIQLSQDGDKVVLTLELADDNLRWHASASSQGVALVPTHGLASVPQDSRISQSLTEVVRPKPESAPPRPGRTQSAPLPDVSNRHLTIAIDPGHGGGDPGAVGIGNIHEADIVLAIANQVTSLLEGKGVTVVQTRLDDSEIELEPRVSQANRASANLFVSIHANAIDLTRPDVNGIETYYYSDRSLALANSIHSSVVAGTGRPNRRVRQARFYVLKNTAMPAVLVEVGFVTGAEDAALLPTSDYQTQMAEAIARGILEYVQQNL